jgi:hypothetical protein
MPAVGDRNEGTNRPAIDVGKYICLKNTSEHARRAESHEQSTINVLVEKMR